MPRKIGNEKFYFNTESDIEMEIIYSVVDYRKDFHLGDNQQTIDISLEYVSFNKNTFNFNTDNEKILKLFELAIMIGCGVMLQEINNACIDDYLDSHCQKSFWRISDIENEKYMAENDRKRNN